MTPPLVKTDALEVEPGVWSVLIEGRSYEVRLVGDEILIGPYRTQVERWRRGGGAAGLQGRAVILAPMPGKIVRVLVGVGDEVTAGQGIVIVEAMKMQNEMKALRAGRVTSVTCVAGDTVNAGAVLAEIG
jgi:biotin carboxyl carrier protein